MQRADDPVNPEARNAQHGDGREFLNNKEPCNIINHDIKYHYAIYSLAIKSMMAVMVMDFT